MLRRVVRFSRYAIFGLSLLLLGATLLLWVRSHWHGDFAIHYNKPRLFEFGSADGLLSVAWGELVSRDYPPSPGWEGTFWGDADSYGGDIAMGTRFGFGLEHHHLRTRDVQIDAMSLTLPYWLLAAFCLAWPVTSFILARRRRKGRGFAVEDGGGGPAPGIDPPPRRPDNIPPP